MTGGTLLRRIFLFAAVALCAAVPRPSDYASLRWRLIGPAIPTGRMTAIGGSNLDPSLYYAGSAGGGIFKSTDGGETWTALFQHEPVSAIGALAVDPHDPNTVWVGTGESNPRNDATYGNGMYVTHDGGRTWLYRGLPESAHISKVIIDPRNPNVVLAGVLGDTFKDSMVRGVYRTDDAGRHWQRTLYVGPETGVSDMAIDPHDPNVVYAGMWQFRRTPWGFSSGGERDGLYRSRDGGRTWVEVTGGGFPRLPRGRIGVAFAPSDPHRVFALVQSREGLLWRSDDSGATWKRMYAGQLIDQRPFYFTHLAVDPRNADHVVALSADISQSFDGGKSFTIQYQTVHADNHDYFWSSDARRIVIAQDGGVSVSQDRARTWSWPANIVTAQIYHLGFDHQTPYHVCVALQDTMSWCGPSNSLDSVGIANNEWIATNANDGMSIWPDPLDPRIVWDSYADGSLGMFNLDSQQRYDVSPAPRQTVNYFRTDNIPYRFNWTSEVALDPLDPHTVFYGGNALFKTTDRGAHWSAISPDLTLNDKAHQAVSGGPINHDFTGAEVTDTIVDIEASPVRHGVIWVGTDDGLIQMTTDGGMHWNNVTPRGLPPYGRVWAVAPSTGDAATAYATIDRHFSGDEHPYVFETTDFGASWRSIANGLPQDQMARTIRPDPLNPSILYLGMEQGIWVSFNRGTTWQPLQLNLPTSAVYDIQVQPESNDLLVGTHGRGLWVLQDLSALQGLAKAEEDGVTLFAPRTAYTYWNWRKQGSFVYDPVPKLPANLYAADNPDAGATVSYYLPSKLATSPTLEIRDESGRLVRTLHNLPNAPGVNRTTWGLGEEPPVQLDNTPLWNQAPSEGAMVLPGTYTLRLLAGGHEHEQRLVVKPDPRATWTQDQYRTTHDFVADIYDDISRLDTILNEITRAHEQTAAMRQLRASITIDPQDTFANVWYPSGLRERLLNLLAVTTGNSQGPPTVEYSEELRILDEDTAKTVAAFDKLKAAP